MPISITDPSDPRVAVYCGLRDHIARQQAEQPGGPWTGCFMAESELVIGRALGAGQEIVSLLFDAGRPPPTIEQLDSGVSVYAAAPAVLAEISGRPKLRDPIACFRRRPLPDAADLLAAAKAIAVLENVTNPNNMGVIMRCAAGLGIDAVLLDPTSCDPLYRRAIRASMGEVFAVPHARLDPFPAGLQPLADHAVRVLALTPAEDAVALHTVSITSDERIAVLLGAEGPGLSPAALGAATERIRIPMTRGVDSLNVGAAAAIAFHTIGVARRQL